MKQATQYFGKHLTKISQKKHVMIQQIEVKIIFYGYYRHKNLDKNLLKSLYEVYRRNYTVKIFSNVISEM